MALFKRRGREAEDEYDEDELAAQQADEAELDADGGFADESTAVDSVVDPADGLPDDGDPAELDEPAPSPLSERPDGPFDLGELPDDDETERLDLGGIQLAVPPGIEVRLDLDQQQQVVAATLVAGEELVQIGVFAAPRTEGIWDEVRAEIQESIVATGGAITLVEGPFGTELNARIPTDTPGVFAPARFVGINGPRWFMRALFSGPLTAEGKEEPLLALALRGVVVVRGADAMAPRDGLPLRLPNDAALSAEAAMALAAAESEEAQSEAAPAERALYEMPERGPEITEIH